MKNIAQKRIPATLNSSQPLQRKVLAAVVAACFISAAQANPAAPQVVAGQASFNQQGNLFSITNTPNTIINWQSFSIGANDITRFIQQSSDSKVLNRITGQDPSQILGALQSNGKVFLINPNGVMFGAGSRVDVNGLVASSLNLSDADFLAGKNNFVGNASAGKVSNQGTITTPGGGQVFLIAPNVDNSGIITSPNGEIILAAGESVQLVDSANPDVHVQISAPLDQALNLGQIVAQGGRVGIYGALVNQRGHVSADSAVRGDAGQIILKSSGTTLLEAGSTTTATGANGAGGSVELLGQQVGLMGNAKVDASGATGGGTVLVGGDYHGQNPAVQNAQSSYVGADAAIAADAVQTGQGGKVIVWSDQATRAYGSISARGGAQGGDGGFVETSGAYLDVAGIKVSTAAAHGTLGRWLLDPDDITVTADGGSSLEGVSTFGAGSGSSTIDPSAFNGSSTSVVLQANNSITFSSPVAMTQLGAGLTAQAGGDIAVHAPISTNNGAVSLLANDAGGIQANGQVHVYNGGAINTHTGGVKGGDITLSGAAVTVEGSLDAGNGNISLSANGGTTPSAGNIAITGPVSGVGSSDQIGMLTADTATLMSTNDITFVNAPVSLVHQSGPAMTAFAGNNITLGNYSSITSSGGDIDLEANSSRFGVATGSGVLTVTDLSRGIGSNGGNVQLVGASLVLSDDVNANGATGGLLTVQSNAANGAITVNQFDTLSADAGISLQADSIVLHGAISTANALAIDTYSPGIPINLGAGATSSNGVLGLSDTSLRNISAANIAIGANSSGPINVTGALDLTGNGFAAASEFMLAGGSVAINAPLTTNGNLRLAPVVAGGAISINAAVTVNGNNAYLTADSMALNGSITMTGTNGSVSIDSVADGTAINLGVGAVSSTGVLGISDTALRNINAANISIGSASQGVLSVTGALDLTGNNNAGSNEFRLGGGSIVVNAPLTTNASLLLTPTVANGAITINPDVTVTGNTVSLQADSMALNGNINAVGGSLSINPFSSGTVINVGADAVSSTGVLGISDAALRNMSSTEIAIGTNTGNSQLNVVGALDLTGGLAASRQLQLIGSNIAINAPLSVTQNLDLIASSIVAGNLVAGTITQITGGVITAPALSFLGSSVTLGSANIVGNLAGRASAGDVYFTNGGSGSLNLSGIDGQSGVQAQNHTVTLNTGGNISQDAYGYLVASKVMLNTPGRVDLTAAGGTNMIGVLEAQSIGSLNLTQAMIPLTLGGDGYGVTLSGGLGGRSIVITDHNGITVAQPVNGSGAPVSLTGGSIGIGSGNSPSTASVSGSTVALMGSSLTIGGGASVSATGTLTMNADAMSLPTTADVISASAIVIGTNTAGHAITLGSSDTGPTVLKLSPAALAAMSSSDITVTSTGGVSVVQAVSLSGGLSLYGGTAGINVDAALSANTLSLTADRMSFSAPLTAQLASFTNASSNLPIQVGYNDGGTCVSCLALTDMSQVNATAISVGSASGSAVSGPITVAGYGGILAGTPTPTTLTLLTGAGITQTGPIITSALGVQAGGSVVLTDPGNAIGSVAAQLTAGDFTLATTTPLVVTRLTGNLASSVLYDLNGISTPGNVSLTSSGAITRDSIAAGDGGITANTLTLVAGNGIGADGAPLVTSVVTLDAKNTTGSDGGSSPTNIQNTDQNVGTTQMTLARAWQSADGPGQNSGSITIENIGAMVVSDSSGVKTDTGAISLRTHSPLDIDGQVSSNSGAITLSAGPSGGSNDTLTIANGNLVSTSGAITLTAGGNVTVTSGTVSGNVTTLANQNLPDLSTCIANPSTAGCASVLPSLSSCIANSTLPGCSVVLASLPSLASCTANPALANCSLVLPSLTSCISAPSQTGCSVVLPTLASCLVTPLLPGFSSLPSLTSCTANPALANCSLVLPSLTSCISAPSQTGCSAVLPTLASCLVTPSLPGCSSLPSLSSCTANPALANCSLVLPSLTSCITTPSQTGCSVVLPTLASCLVTPSLPGCSSLPSLSSCTANPALANCSLVLPSLTSCISTPSQTGCSVVLPTLASCTSAPTTPGCSVVLPTLGVCTSAPTTPGCSVVLPTLGVCTSAPTTPGCSVVLPTVGACTLAPTTPGCSVVLPTLGVCTSAPTTPGCSVVLPTVGACTLAPTTPGCSAVLPTLGTCTSAPTTPGCSAVLPTLGTCTSAPTTPGCSAVLPTLGTCTSAPTTPGCSAVLPTVGACTLAPTTPGCSAV